MRSSLLLPQGREIPATCPGIRCRVKIMRWLRSQVTNPEDAEDLSGEICLHCMGAIHRFRGDAEFETWLYRISRNVLNSFLRTRHRAIQAENIARLDALNEFTLLSQPTPGPDEIAERVWDALGALTPKQRRLIEWKYSDGLTLSEIASQLDVSAGAASQALYRARKAFKAAYASRESAASR